MSGFPADPGLQYKVLVNAHGRPSLWPARKAVPTGWREALPARSKAECLKYIGVTWTDLNVRPRRATKSEGRESRETIAFSLMFFGEDEGNAAADKYRFLIEAARYADTHGFAALWLPERHFTRLGGLYPNPAVLHAALARETQRIRLRAGSVVLPLHDPLRVAEEWAVVDNLSEGRVEISFAPGWNPGDFVLQPDHYDRRYEIMYENIRIMERLWSGQTVERTDGTGQTISLRTYPKPVQPSLIKWITAAGNPQSFQQAGAIGAHLLTHLFDQDVDELAAKIKLYRDARRQHGWDPDAGRVAVALHTYLADSLEQVNQNARQGYCDYLRANAKLLEKLAHSRGVPLDVSRLGQNQLDEAIAWMFDKFFFSRSLLGTPQTCTDLVRRLIAAGVQEIACLLDFGPSTQAIRESLPHLSRLKDCFQTATAVRSDCCTLQDAGI